MTKQNLMRNALGPDWHRLPAALKAHYSDTTAIDEGHLNIEYPFFMQPYLSLMSWFGVLLNRRGQRVATTVVKEVAGDRQHWRRTLTFSDGKTVQFNSVWVAGEEGHVIEFVNRVLGLEMAPFVVGQQLHYRGIRFVAKLGRWMLPIPEWLALGHTQIIEEAIDERRFEMDFRMTHPWFGQLFRYSGTFEADVRSRFVASGIQIS